MMLKVVISVGMIGNGKRLAMPELHSKDIVSGEKLTIYRSEIP